MFEQDTRAHTAEKGDILAPQIRRYLASLGLTFEYVADKKVLDIGSNDCVLASEAQERGIQTITSLDINHESLMRADPSVGGRVVGDAFKALPFSSESIDLALVRGLAIGKDDKSPMVMDEIRRVLKKDGEVRIWPALSVSKMNIFADTPEATLTQRLKAIIQSSHYWIEQGYDVILVRVDPEEVKNDNLFAGECGYYWRVGKRKLDGDKIQSRKNAVIELIEEDIKKIHESSI